MLREEQDELSAGSGCCQHPRTRQDGLCCLLLMAFDCGCQPGPWHCVLAGSVRFVSRAGADSWPWGELSWAGGKPHCAGTHPCPALPLSWQGGQGWPAHGMCVAPGRHSWHVGHSAHGAKPSSWCRWCLALFPLVQVAQALWHSNQTGCPQPPCVCHSNLGIFGGFLGAAACGCTSCCDLGARELWHEPNPCSQPDHPPGYFFSCFAALCAALIASSPMCPPQHISNSPAHPCALGVTRVLQMMAVSLGEPCSSPALPTCFSGSRRKVKDSQKLLRGATSWLMHIACKLILPTWRRGSQR